MSRDDFLNLYLCAHFCRYSPIFFDNLMTEWGGVKSKLNLKCE